MIPFPDKKYQIIYADPPWKFEVWSYGTGLGRSPDNYYATIPVEDICKLPVTDIADKNCILFLWTTFPKLIEALQVIEAWGFRYRTNAFLWVKQNPNSMSFFEGLGYWTRKNTEPCLLATRGSPHRHDRDVPELIIAPRMAHSRKPDEIVRDRIIRLVGDLPRIELFARRKVEGGDCWGNEVESDIEL